MRGVWLRRASLPGGTLTFAAGLLISLGLIWGCGGGSKRSPASLSHAPPPVCRPAARAIVARMLAIGPTSVSTTPATGNNAQPECRFLALADRRRVRVVANVDGSPQAYQRLERTIVEASQQFGTVRNFAAPVHVAGLGLDASWFPDLRQLMTTDGRRLITVSVIWPRVAGRRMERLAVRVARPYLGALDRSAASPPA